MSEDLNERKTSLGDVNLHRQDMLVSEEPMSMDVIKRVRDEAKNGSVKDQELIDDIKGRAIQEARIMNGDSTIPEE